MFIKWKWNGNLLLPLTLSLVFHLLGFIILQSFIIPRYKIRAKPEGEKSQIVVLVGRDTRENKNSTENQINPHTRISKKEVIKKSHLNNVKHNKLDNSNHITKNTELKENNKDIILDRFKKTINKINHEEERYCSSKRTDNKDNDKSIVNNINKIVDTGEFKSGDRPHYAGVRIVKPDFNRNPRPIYPLIARKKGYEGTVYLRIRIDSDGRVLESKIEKSSGFAILDKAALRASLKWKFKPAEINGKKVPSTIIVPVVFKLIN